MANSPYTAVVISSGDARAGGRASSPDGEFDVVTNVPGYGEGTNPEQLFAAGWSTCFHSAVKYIAHQGKLPIEDSAVVAEVTLNDSEEGPFLSAVIRLEVSGIDQAAAEELAAAAHQMCPYSKATRGNIEVKIETTAA